jgi:thiamine-monophosphate kinase
MARRSARDGEESFVAWLTSLAGDAIGDDAALLHLSGDYAWTVDAQHEGVHLPLGCDPAIAGRRLLAVNLSDLAAVGAEPRFCLLSLAAPPGYDRRRFVGALLASAARVGVRLVGGDTSSLGSMSATLALLGRRRAGGRWLERRNARAGDVLYCGGTLGESALGLALLRAGASPQGNGAGWRRGAPALPASVREERTMAAAARRALRRHLLPTPQLELSRRLARARTRVAAIDVSDGLGKDLARLYAASGVGAEVERLPLASGAEPLAAALGLDAIELALGGGEDYVLVFTLPAGVRPPPGCARIGRMVAVSGVWLCAPGTPRREIAAAGFDHLGAAAPRTRRRHRSPSPPASRA